MENKSSLKEAINSLSYLEEIKLVDAISKMMHARHHEWIKAFMVGRTVESVGSMPYLSATGSEKFINKMIKELKDEKAGLD